MPINIDSYDPRAYIEKKKLIGNPVHMQGAGRIIEIFEDRAIHRENGELSLALMRLRRDMRIAQAMQCSVIKNQKLAEDIAKKGKTPDGRNVLEDCLPCSSRVKDLLNFNPFEQILDMFQGSLNVSLGNMQNLFKSLLDSGLDPNMVCTLTNYLSGKCLPDIAGLIALLGFYISQIMIDLKTKISWKAVIGFAINILLSPILSSFGFVDQFEKMVRSIIRCIISDLNTQLRKIENAQTEYNRLKEQFAEEDKNTADQQSQAQAAADAQTVAGNTVTGTITGTVLEEKNKSLQIDPKKIEKQLLGPGTPLAELLDMISAAEEKARAQLNKLIITIMDMLNLSNGDMTSLTVELGRFKKVIAIFGLIKQIYQDVQNGGLCANPDLDPFDRTKHFLLANASDSVLLPNENTIIIRRPEIPIPEELVPIVKGITDIIVLTQGDRHTIRLTDGILVRNQCAEFSGDQELTRWLKNLQQISL